jgi:voltage-gated sodium channel
VSLSFQEELEDSLYELLIIEYIILILFVVEIALKTYAFQLKFLKDGWNIFDIIVVLVCFGLTTAELIDTDNVKSGIFKFTGFLRLLRIVVMFRKITEMRNI